MSNQRERESIVLLVSPDDPMGEELQKQLGIKFCVFRAEDMFAAGVAVGKFEPDTIVIDFAMGRDEAINVMSYVKLEYDTEVICIGIVGTEEQGIRSYTEPAPSTPDDDMPNVDTFDAIYRHPASIKSIAKYIKLMVAEFIE